jgi:hypothetical protein
LENGAIAQLGERFNGIEEVVGSIPSGSTNSFNKLRKYFGEVGLAFDLKSPPRRHRAPSSPNTKHIRYELRNWENLANDAREKLPWPLLHATLRISDQGGRLGGWSEGWEANLRL